MSRCARCGSVGDDLCDTKSCTVKWLLWNSIHDKWIHINTFAINQPYVQHQNRDVATPLSEAEIRNLSLTNRTMIMIRKTFGEYMFCERQSNGERFPFLNVGTLAFEFRRQEEFASMIRIMARGKIGASPFTPEQSRIIANEWPNVRCNYAVAAATTLEQAIKNVKHSFIYEDKDCLKCEPAKMLKVES